MPKLMILVGSVREGRIGLRIAEWAKRAVDAYGRFDIDFADLAEIALPFMDEPKSPRLRQYTRAHTIEWSERVEASDVFLFLFPEYNYSYAPAIKNAIDYLHFEWHRKPVGFVNWGGNSGGTRAQVAFRVVVSALGLVITKGNVEINFPQRQVNDAGEFEPNEQQRLVLAAQLTEIVKLDQALTPLR